LVGFTCYHKQVYLLKEAAKEQIPRYAMLPWYALRYWVEIRDDALIFLYYTHLLG